jgi:hypothetical protein
VPVKVRSLFPILVSAVDFLLPRAQGFATGFLRFCHPIHSCRFFFSHRFCCAPVDHGAAAFPAAGARFGSRFLLNGFVWRG